MDDGCGSEQRVRERERAPMFLHVCSVSVSAAVQCNVNDKGARLLIEHTYTLISLSLSSDLTLYLCYSLLSVLNLLRLSCSFSLSLSHGSLRACLTLNVTQEACRTRQRNW